MSGSPSTSRVAPPTQLDGGAELLAWLRKMRDEQPVAIDNLGVYHIFRYEDVKSVVNDPISFSNDQGKAIPDMAEFAVANMAWSDPPYHTKLRKLINQAFTPRTVAQLEPQIEEIYRQLLDNVSGESEFDFATRIAMTLPALVMASLLGVPASDSVLFKEWMIGLFLGQLDKVDPIGKSKAAFRVVVNYLEDITRERRAHPKDDLISALTAGRVDGVGLTDNEVASFGGLLLLAGYHTTVGLLNNTVLCLDETPDALQQLHDEPSLVEPAVEEVLRYRPPGTAMGRVAQRDVEFSGVPVRANSLMKVWMLSANRDERVFTDPDRFDIHRAPNPHTTFGHGIHFCVGAPLGRREGAIALRQFVEHFAEIRVVPDADLDFYEQSVFTPRTLPVMVKRR